MSSSSCLRIRSKSFHSPAASGSLSLARARESNQREHAPDAALARRSCASARGHAGVRLTYVPIRSRTDAHPARPPSDGSVAPSPRQTGTQDQEPIKSTVRRAALLQICLLILSPFNAPSIAGFGGSARRGARTMRACSRTYRDVRRANPAEAEKRRAPRSFIARCVVGGGLSLVTFSWLVKRK